MKIRARPKVSHKTILYTTIHTYLNQNNHPLSNPIWISSALYYTIKLVFVHFILIKT